LFNQATATLTSAVKRRSRSAATTAYCLFAILVLQCLPANLTAATESKTFIFILSGDSPAYARVASATERLITIGCANASIECKQLSFESVSIDKVKRESIDNAYLSISLGKKATDWIQKPYFTGRQINAMLPEPPFVRKKTGNSRSIARIYIDQPYGRYFDLIRTTIPRAVRVGLLIHESNLDQIDTIAESARQHELSLKPSVVSSERDVGEALSYLLGDIDVLLALPDARIHNSQTISHILTTAYRNDIPVIGFSSAYVKAGATAAVYTSPEDIARQIADTVMEYLLDRHVTRRLQKANYFSISFNFEVARSLGLPPLSPSEIKQAILEGAGR
jgi:putative tryptophan/tyrosine transport system substrate-binding protein